MSQTFKVGQTVKIVKIDPDLPEYALFEGLVGVVGKIRRILTDCEAPICIERGPKQRLLFVDPSEIEVVNGRS